MKKRRFSYRLVLGIAVSAVLVVLGALKMFGLPFYIPEAKQPEGFPAPGRVNQIVVKSYPLYRSATVKSSDAGQNRLFGSLFNHIKSNKIAMTAPVEMTFDGDEAQSMAFLYTNATLGDTGYDGDVLVADQEATQVVSIAVRGSYNQQRFQKYCDKLREWAEQSDEWELCGEARYLGFNSPFVPSFLRYGEVQIPIKARS